MAITGTLDSQTFVCRGTLSFKSHYDSSVGRIRTTFECGGAVITCLAYSLYQSGLTINEDCTSPPPPGNFPVVHLPALTTIQPGQSANLLVQVYNNTGKALSGVTIAATGVSSCSLPSRAMASGAVVSYQCTTPPLTADLTNTITVSATAADGSHFSGTAAAIIRVDNPRLSIFVRPPQQNVLADGSAAWTVRVTNNGPSTLTSGIFADQRGNSTCGATSASIAGGAAVEYNCGVAAVVTSFTDMFTASAMSGSSPLVDDQSTTVTVVTDEIFRSGFEITVTDRIFKNGFE